MKAKNFLNLGMFCVLCVLVTLLAIGCGSHERGDRVVGLPAPSAAYQDGASTKATPSIAPMHPEAFSVGPRASTPAGTVMSLPARPGEELWVIAKPGVRVAAHSDDVPGSGALVIEQPVDPGQPHGEKRTIPIPLKHTDVKASIRAYIATVDVTQQFHNPYDSKIEAVYVFPLPDNAAVNEFVMTIGERKIRGIIRERAEAEKIYNEARSQGYNAALLTQERPNIFTQKVANIEPGKQIDIQIRYFHTLAYNDGWYSFHFPMVVGPRYNPAHTAASGQGIGAVGRASPPNASGQNTEIQYLRPNERSGHDISLSVDVDAGVSIEEFTSRSHQIKSSKAEGRLQVAIDPADSIPNKDFVLQYRVAGDQIKSNLLVHRDNRGGYFTLMLYPPKDLNHLPRRPMEMVFVLDCSGSMNGYPIEKSKEAIRHALKTMNATDTFQVINFSNSASQLGNRPLVVNEQNVQAALNYVDRLQGEGGTEMITGIKAALDFPQSEGRQRVVAFLTDGYIGNESEIVGEMHKRLNNARVFSFGIGSSVNRHLIESMARLGRGAVAYVGPDDSGPDIMDHFFQRISKPALTDITIDFGSMKVRDVFPKRVPDLFVGRPVLLVGRFDGEPPSQIRVVGKAGQEQVAMNVNVQPMTHDGSAVVNGAAIGGIPAVWARMQIEALSDQLTHTNDPHQELAGSIKKLALDYSLMSAYTAFVAVDSSRRTEGASGTTVPVPVPVPAGVKYETTVKE